MTEIFLAHLIGDFLLQPKKMALAKGSDSGVCATHCLVYTACVVLAMAWSTVSVAPWWAVPAIFIPHFLIDRFSLAGLFMSLTGNRDFLPAMTAHIKFQNMIRSMPEGIVPGTPEASKRAREMGLLFYDAHFTAIVYVVIDQTFHLICLYALWRMVS